jgi:hypothetical protein
MQQSKFALWVVRLPGFEPGLEAWKASILDQSRPQPHETRIQSIIKTKYLLLSRSQPSI